MAAALFVMTAQLAAFGLSPLHAQRAAVGSLLVVVVAAMAAWLLGWLLPLSCDSLVVVVLEVVVVVLLVMLVVVVDGVLVLVIPGCLW